jgi:AraC-like DNA-binding protein
MGQIISLFVWKVIEQVDPSVDKRRLLKSVGVDPDAPISPFVLVKDTAYYEFLESLAQADPKAIGLPLRTGASMKCEEYGAFGLAWKSAHNLNGSYLRAERYGRALSSVSRYAVETTEDGGYIFLHRDGDRRLGMRLSNEATIASIIQISKEVSINPFTPLAVYFKHKAPGTSTVHEEYFGCPVHFNSDRDALMVSHQTLQTPNKLGDESYSKFFDSHLETELAKLTDDVSLDKRVGIQISQSLSEGLPTMSEIAGRLGMSGRTLQRRLSDQGHTYQFLVDEARRQLAQRLLEQTDYGLAEIAFLTGFSEQSAFTRAFKRWEGQTPRSFRLQAQPASS